MIAAFNRYLVVKPIKSDKEFVKTGIVATHTQANLICKAIILSVGSDEAFYFDEERTRPILKPGDTVFVHEFPKDSQVDPETGEEVMFIREDTIYGYVKKNN